MAIAMAQPVLGLEAVVRRISDCLGQVPDALVVFGMNDRCPGAGIEANLVGRIAEHARQLNIGRRYDQRLLGEVEPDIAGVQCTPDIRTGFRKGGALFARNRIASSLGRLRIIRVSRSATVAILWFFVTSHLAPAVRSMAIPCLILQSRRRSAASGLCRLKRARRRLRRFLSTFIPADLS